MTVISSSRLKEATRMSDQIASEDIVEVNEAGQTVVVVPKGQPIPTHLLPTKPAVKKVAGPAENKARKAPVSSKKSNKS